MSRTRKPTELHLVEDTLNVTRHRDRKAEPKPTGRPVKPAYVKGRAAKIWKQDLAIAYWLTAADARPFAEWCRMSAELETTDKDPAWRAQWRMIGQELGFFNASRSKINVESNGKKKDDSDKFY